MGEWIKGIHHVNIRAAGSERFDEAVKFYTEVLGMELISLNVRENGAKSAMIDAGNSRMEIGMGTEDDILPQGAIRHFALGTDKVAEVTERVRAAGYEITREPRPRRIAFCIGPCGEEIEIFYQE